MKERSCDLTTIVRLKICFERFSVNGITIRSFPCVSVLGYFLCFWITTKLLLLLFS